MASNQDLVWKLLSNLSKPTSETYNDWEWDLTGIIQNSDAYNRVLRLRADGTRPTRPVPANAAQPTQAETADIQRWDSQAEALVNWISRASGPACIDVVRPFTAGTDAVGLLSAIQRHFIPTDFNAQISALRALTGTRKSTNETWEEFFKRQDDICRQFDRIFPTDIASETLKGLGCVLMTLSSLPPDHAIRGYSLAPGATLKSESIRTSIRSHIIQNGAEPPTETAAVAQSSSDAECYLCGLKNHFIATCNWLDYYKSLLARQRREGTGPFAGRGGSRGRGTRGTRGRGRGGRTGTANTANTDNNPTDAPEFTEFAGSASLSTPLTAQSSNYWVADTGASSSMTFRRDWVMQLRPDRRKIKLADGNVVYSAGIGFALVSPQPSTGRETAFRIENVLYVPDLRSNLISVLSLTRKQGYHCVINSSGMSFRLGGQAAFSAPIQTTNTAYLDVKTHQIQPEEVAGQASTDSEASREIWHDRCCHRASDTIWEAQTRGAVLGMKFSSSSSDKRAICVPCIEGKLTRAVHTMPAVRAAEPLARIHTDVHGPVDVLSREGHSYFVTFIDQHSGFVALYCIRKKSDVFEAFKQYKTYAENAMKAKIQALDDDSLRQTILALRDDKGGEYSSNEFDRYLSTHGIQRERTIRDTPQQNGLAERYNRTATEAVKAMLAQSRLPASMWADAVRVYTHVHNRIPSRSRGFKSPFELWHGRKPSVAHLRVFGCRAYVHVQKDQRPQLASHARKCVFIGYAPDQKGYVFYDSERGGTLVSDSAVFVEDEFPGALRIKSGEKAHTIPDLLQDLPRAPEQPPDIVPLPIPHHQPSIQPSHSISQPSATQVAPEQIPLPPSPPPERDDAPTARDDGTNLYLRLPGRHNERDPARQREIEQAERPVPREVARLLDPEHFSSGRPEQGLSRTRSGAQQAHYIELSDEQAMKSSLHTNTDTPAATNEDTTPPVTRVSPMLPHSQSTPFTRPSTIPRSSWANRPPSKVATSALVSLDDALDFVFHTSTTLEPSSLAEARKRPDAEKWVDAALEELRAHLENGTWELARLPHGKKAIGSRWVFKVKRNADGEIERYKGRLVAKGYAQREGVDYTDTFAPTARFAALRTVIALAAVEDWELEAVDISTAFLNGEIDAEVYMEIPEGVKIDGLSSHDWVLKLLKGLYGIKQGPRIWNRKLNEVLTTLGFTRLECDHSVYIYERDNIKIIVPIHVDDLVIASKSKDAISTFKAQLAAHFKIRDLGPATSILGIKVERDRAKRIIKLSQTAYIDSILAEHAPYETFNGADVPMQPSALSEKMCPQNDEEKKEMEKIPYRAVVGKLLYLAIATRPDIAYAVGVLCRYNANPGMRHWAAAKHLLRYLKRSRDLKLHYGPDDSAEPFATFCDADLGGNVDNARSTCGYTVRVGGGAVMWGSRLQRHVSLSSTESEYTTVCAVATETMWMRFFFEEIGYDMSKGPSTIWMDSNSAIQVAKNPEHVSTMKHVHRAFHWIRDRVESGDIRVSHIAGSQNPADIFTKPLARAKFHLFRDMLGLRP